MANAIVLKKLIPPQITNVGASFGPLMLTEFLGAEDGSKLTFSAELLDQSALPAGLICSPGGIVSGIAAKSAVGMHEVRVTVTHESGETATVEFRLAIRPRLTVENDELFTKLKATVWEAIGKNLPPPELSEFLNRPITVAEIYYLLQRFATLTIWDVYNLEQPGDKHLLKLAESSPHYDIYDRGSCLVGVPKNLFSHERTLEDTLQTARVMAREVYKRGWVIEFAGFNKMVRAAWVELQHLGQENDKQLEILHFSPSPEDVKLYLSQAKTRSIKPTSTV
jgi:hypothetical protein